MTSPRLCLSIQLNHSSNPEMTIPFPMTRMQPLMEISKENMGHLFYDLIVLWHETGLEIHQHFRWHTSLNHSPCFEIFASPIGMRYLILLLSVYNDSYVLQVECFVFHRVILFLVQITLFCYLATEFMDPVLRAELSDLEFLLTHKSITKSKVDP